MNRLAQIPVPINNPGPSIGAAGPDSGITLGAILSMAVGAMTIIAAIWFLFKIITGGMAMINSDGDKQAVEDARNSITYGVVGIIVIISATFLVNLLGYLFGVDSILDIANWINIISDR